MIMPAEPNEPEPLAQRVLDLIEQAGLRRGQLSADDLAPLDEFHTGGRRATRALLRMLGDRGPRRVIDLGCGIGGPARYLARRWPAAEVVGLDRSHEFCVTARVLTLSLNLENLEVVEGDILDDRLVKPPFDLIWLQHATMTIADKVRLAQRLQRLASADGGLLAVHEAFAGPDGVPLFPVPWADRADESHLMDPDEWRALLAGVGFAEVDWRETTAEAAAWIDETVAQRRAAGPDAAPRLSPAPLMGPDAALKSRNLRRNLEEGRVRLFMGVFRVEN